MNCPACQREIPDDAAFCGYCGGAVQTERSCPGCGRSNPSDMSFCSGCGASLSAQTPASDTAAPATPGPGDSIAPAASFAAGRYTVQRFLGEGANGSV